ncbi:antigen 5 like allergen Cul n 1-like [Eurosta solidaginis]|uniref:antigen 5 like allergen Cul n 1-like n=1 Tax=Eurosta solidaginis TaxID=178769 RepID=UPI0035317191
MNLKHILIPALLYIFPAIVNGSLADVNYCSDEYTCSGQREEHVLACKHNGEFHKRCPPNAKVILMTNEFKQLFLHEHNYYRNEIAEGSKYLRPAIAMATLEWDDELAYFAELNVKQCTILKEEEKCFKTASYNALGQNIGWVYYKSRRDCSTLYDDIKKHIRDEWYKESDHFNQAAAKSYQPGKQSIERFAKMVMDRNNRVGCAAVLFEDRFTVTVLFTCNYARRLFCNKPIFRSGREPGSQCKTGTNFDYPFLCSTKEVFDPNVY